MTLDLAEAIPDSGSDGSTWHIDRLAGPSTRAPNCDGTLPIRGQYLREVWGPRVTVDDLAQSYISDTAAHVKPP